MSRLHSFPATWPSAPLHTTNTLPPPTPDSGHIWLYVLYMQFRLTVSKRWYYVFRNRLFNNITGNWLFLMFSMILYASDIWYNNTGLVEVVMELVIRIGYILLHILYMALLVYSFTCVRNIRYAMSIIL